MPLPEWVSKWMEQLDDPIEYTPMDATGRPFEENEPTIIGTREVPSSDYSDIALNRSLEDHQMDWDAEELSLELERQRLLCESVDIGDIR